MSLRSVNLDTYSLSLLAAKEDILNPRSSINWVIFAYDGITDNLKLADSGAGGVAELAGKFHISKPQYGLCKVGSVETGAPQIAMISWVGEHVEEYRRTECASHVPAIKHFFKEAHVFIGAEKLEDVTEERIRAELNKALAQAPGQWVRRSSRSADKEELVGTNYRKTNAAMEMRRINRESFWARAEREEEERKDEERKRTTEERRRLEKERILKERRDAEERDRKMNEKLQMIEEQRTKQAEQEEEMRRKEKLRWEQQQREHKEDMRARLRRSESIEKAAEAAELVSQRSMNPREFFRQLSSSSSSPPSSKSPTSPGSSRTGKPFRRYQRSLTDTAFIFSKAEESAASSPRSPPLVSPFSRAPPSPSYRAASSPTSPDFGPVSSPPMHGAPVSPPASPLRPSPPASALPSHPQTSDQVQAVVEPKPPSPTESSEPPASLGLLVSLSPKLAKNSQSQSNPDTLPASPPNTPTQPEDSTFCFEPVHSPQAPAARLPEIPQPNADLDAMPELVSDIGYKAQAVLVEEDEEEDEEGHAGEVAEAQPQPCVATTEAIQTEAEEQDGEEEDTEEEERKEEGLKQEGEDASVEVLVEGVQEEEEGAEEDTKQTVQSEDSQALAETAESAATDAEPVGEEVKHESVVLATNGITNGENTQEQNGTERSLSPSDAELSSPEPVVCSSPHGRAEEDVVEDEDQEIFKNGQEVLAAQQMCVRALYDYQAEDESEISFEPGDIIRDVETVDKAWWRGWSKDGRQGLFPANYVETI